ncbi:NHL repeat-containing protein [Conexibacter stalactiti]|uniref:NHL repeat-containing protein n=1 Tax=Conexibacter stalactiti TaxID=1940611 RepID=A0ABU4HJM9_9ACTN|nr:NHL repeat-containing protein [Conexibacter stalactiti]MDW5593515.1 NHL repeat-containing protein [Conexibacter stalactiti]MEC5034156.1 NHL repeat-containing protein [Conexibacter stalactiti]
MKSKRAHVAPKAALVGIAATLLLPGAALAASSYTWRGSFSGQGSSDGLMVRPKHIVVESRTGYIFATDSGNGRIQIFRPSGVTATYLTQFDTGLTTPVGLAIDQDTGDLYVSDSGSNEIVKLTSDGASTPTYTVDPTFTSPTGGAAPGEIGNFAAPVELAPNGDLLVADPGDNKVQRYDGDGDFIREFDGSSSPAAFTGLRDIAVDGDGEILVVDANGDIFDVGTSRVVRFDADGGFIATVGPVPTPDSVGIDPNTDDVVVSGNINDSYWNSNPLKYYVFRADGAPRSEGELPGSIVYSGLPSTAIDGANAKRLYILSDRDPSDGFGEVTIQVLDPPLAAAATTLGAQSTESTARLWGRVDPNRQATRYWFEWGVSDSYGQSIPAARDGDAGRGDNPLEVSRSIVGLQAGTTYHYRVVAENDAGTVYGADRTFTVTGSVTPSPTIGLPDGRGLEIVSPGRAKGSGELSQQYVQTTGDGTRAVYLANNPFGDAGHGLGGIGTSLAFVAQRTASGWTSQFATNAPQPSTALNASSFRPDFLGASTDLSRTFFTVEYYRTPGFTSGVWSNDAAGRPSLLAARPASTLASPVLLLSSDDGDHRVIVSQRPIGPVPGPIVPVGNTLWEQTESGQLRLVNVDDAGDLLHETSASVGSGGGSGLESRPLSTQKHSISHDGSRIFFLSRAPGSSNSSPARLYVRVDGERTIELSASAQSSPTSPTSDALFAGASADGTKVFFATSDQLTDDATGPGPFLYEYDLAEGATSGTLKLIAGLDHPVSTTFVANSSTESIAQTLVADDGSAVYYLSADDGGSVYVYDTVSGVTQLVARGVGAVPLAPTSDSLLTSIGAETTPDGRYLLFGSSRELVAGVEDTNDGRKLYRYDAVSGEVTLVSTTPTAPPTRFDADVRGRSFSNINMPIDANAISDDGRYVFFQTSAALLPSDTNSKLDVYRWQAGDGVAMVTDGVGKSDSNLAGASTDGTSVFFLTLNDLLPQDGDGFYDLYVARVGGGFPYQGEPTPCSGDACQGTPTTPPAGPKSLSDAFSGSGNAADEPAPQKAKAGVTLTKPSAKQKRTLAASGSITLSVKSVTAGTVNGRLLVKSGKRWTRVGSGKASAKAGGTVRITLKLSSAMRARLARTGTLRVRVEVAHAGGGATKSNGFVIRAAKPAKSSAVNGGLR